MFEIRNKVALITGAASGIGLAYSKELLRKELKAVAIVDINETNGEATVKEIIAEFKRDDCVIFIKADVTDNKQLEDAFDKTAKTYNQLDIVINNAGVFNEVNWEKCVAVNFSAVVSGSRLAIEKYFPKYKSKPETLIINTASIAGLYPTIILPVYSATKSGVIAYTRSLACSYEDQNTKIIAICPCFVDTPLIKSTENVVPEPYLWKSRNTSKGFYIQKAEEVARNVMGVIPNAPSGSVWTVTVEGTKMYEFPSLDLSPLMQKNLE